MSGRGCRAWQGSRLIAHNAQLSWHAHAVNMCRPAAQLWYITARHAEQTWEVGSGPATRVNLPCKLTRCSKHAYSGGMCPAACSPGAVHARAHLHHRHRSHCHVRRHAPHHPRSSPPVHASSIQFQSRLFRPALLQWMYCGASACSCGTLHQFTTQQSQPHAGARLLTSRIARAMHTHVQLFASFCDCCAAP